MSDSERAFCPQILSLAAALGLTPKKVRGVSQCSFQVVIMGAAVTLWVGYYPGFAGKAHPHHVWQASLSDAPDAARFGLTEEGIREFLKSSLFLNPVTVARKAKDLKSLLA
jgi:hypothetical protein